jgi:hypothetical protein
VHNRRGSARADIAPAVRAGDPLPLRQVAKFTPVSPTGKGSARDLNPASPFLFGEAGDRNSQDLTPRSSEAFFFLKGFIGFNVDQCDELPEEGFVTVATEPETVPERIAAAKIDHA